MRKSGFKWFLSLLLYVCMVAMMAPAAFAADASVSNYDDLVKAIANAEEGDTITLGADITLYSQLEIDKNITIDLNQNTLSGAASTMLAVKAETTIKNGTIAPSDGGIYANSKLLLENVNITGKATDHSLLYVNRGAEVTIDKDSTVSATATTAAPYPAVFVGTDGGDAAWSQTLNIYGTITAEKSPCIQGNGTDRSTTVINIFDGAKVKTNKLAMFLPQPCEVNMTGGLVQGYCGIGIKSGTLNLSGGTVNGVANDTVIGDQHSQTNGISYDGSAILVDSYIGYAGQVQINISGDAVVKSDYSTGIREIGNNATQTNVVAVNVIGGKVLGGTGMKAIKMRDVSKTTVSLTGGALSSDPTAYLEAGYIVTKQTDGTYTVSVDPDKAVAKVGEKLYLTLSDAIDAAQAGDTITLLKDVDDPGAVGAGIVYDLTGKTLDLGGFTYTTAKTAHIFKGTGGTIKNGKAVCKDGGFCALFIASLDATMTNFTVDGVETTGGIIICNATNVVLKNSTVTGTEDYAVWMYHSASAVIESGVYTAGAVVGNTDNGDTDFPSELTIQGGCFNANGNDNGKDVTLYNGGKVSISGGYFTTDVSDYCVAGKKANANTDDNKDTYAYKVGEVPANDANEIKQADAVGATTTDVSEIPTEKQEAATAVAKSVTPTDISTDKAEVTTHDEQAALTELAKQKKISLDETGKVTDENVTVTIIKQAYLDVAMTAYDVTDTDTCTVGMDITPRYNLVAVATTGDAEPKVEDGCIIDTKREMTVTEPTEITVQLPTDFAGKTVYITHVAKDGNTYYYTATADENGQITFVTDGFSPFIFTLTAPDNIVAVVGGVGYTSFADAVAAANDGDTVILKKAENDMAFTFNTTKTIYIENQTGAAVTIKFNGADKFVAKNAIEEFSYTKLSGGSSASTGYKVTVAAADNGGVTASPSSNVAKGATVTITVTPDKGYKLDKLTATDNSGKTLTLTKKNDTTYTFTMPASAVKVSATFVKEPTKTDFNDVADSAWYADAVQYAVDKGMMNGIGNNLFAPEAVTNRGMIVTVLYRLDGEPNVSASSFVDVAGDAYYAKAVAWASANGIVNGYGNGKFGPNDAITREQFAAILYRYAQYKGYDVTAVASLDAFSDAQTVSAYAVPALRWAVGAGVVNGSNGELNPQSGATRAQAAQLLMNFCENVAK